MDAIPESLKVRFDSIAAQSGMDPDLAGAVFKQLVEAYGEPQRCYHNLSHLAHMFAKQDEAGLDDTACHWATWFHDAVYVPGKSQNESRSAELAAQKLTQLGMPPRRVKRAEQLIRYTKAHDCDDQDQIAHQFLDSDMSILGETPMHYAEYLKGIREEFSKCPDFSSTVGGKHF